MGAIFVQAKAIGGTRAKCNATVGDKLIRLKCYHSNQQYMQIVKDLRTSWVVVP